MKNASIRLYRKDCYFFYCGDTVGADFVTNCSLRAWMTGVLGDLRVRLFNTNKSEYLHDPDENDELVPKYTESFPFAYYELERKCFGLEQAVIRNDRLFAGGCNHGMTRTKKTPSNWRCRIKGCELVAGTIVGNDNIELLVRAGKMVPMLKEKGLFFEISFLYHAYVTHSHSRFSDIYLSYIQF